MIGFIKTALMNRREPPRSSAIKIGKIGRIYTKEDAYNGCAIAPIVSVDGKVKMSCFVGPRPYTRQLSARYDNSSRRYRFKIQSASAYRPKIRSHGGIQIRYLERMEAIHN